MRKPSATTVLQLIALLCTLTIATFVITWGICHQIASRDLTTPPKVLTIPRPTLITLFSADGIAQPAMECTKVTVVGSYGMNNDAIDIETEVGTLHWKGSYLVVDQDKLDAAEAKAEAATARGGS